VSNVNEVRRPASGGIAARSTAVRVPAKRDGSGAFPSAEGTAILDLSEEQTSGIRKLLIGMRLGKHVADDVRTQIYALLTKGQRRVLGAAWFIISVRV
jgi:hypothetical protein